MRTAKALLSTLQSCDKQHAVRHIHRITCQRKDNVDVRTAFVIMVTVAKSNTGAPNMVAERQAFERRTRSTADAVGAVPAVCSSSCRYACARYSMKACFAKPRLGL